MGDSKPEPRHVGFWLGVGILFMPYIFSWFTLRGGHSVTARTIALVWLAFFTFVWTNAAITTEQRNGGQNMTPTDKVAEARQNDQDAKLVWRQANIQMAENAVLQILKDPDSAKFREVTVVAPKVFKKEVPGVVCGFVNSKNSFGGYAGFQRFIVVLNMPMVETDSDNWFRRTWNRECAHRPVL